MESTVIPGLLRNVGGYAGQVLVGAAEEVVFGSETEQVFHHRQGDHFRVADTWLDPAGWSLWCEPGVGVEVVVSGTAAYRVLVNGVF